MKKLVLIVIIFTLPLYFCSKKSEPTEIEFTYPDLNNAMVSLVDFKGKIVLVDIWATWCVPCKKGIPAFIRIYNEYKDRGVEVIGISVDEGGSLVLC